MLIYSSFFILGLFLMLRYVRFFQIDGLSKWTMPFALLLKIAVGLTLFYVHIQTYGIGELSHDGETFLKEGKLLNDVFYQSPKHYLQLLTGIGETEELIHKYLYMTEYWSAGDLTLINDSKNVIRVHSLIHFFSGNSVFIHLALMCLLSLLAAKNIFLVFQQYIKQDKTWLFWFLLIVPSTIFWTSSILKEPFLFFGISIMARALLLNEGMFKRSSYFILACFVLSGFKPYILVCILLALAAVLTYKFMQHRLIWTLLVLFSVVLIFGFMLETPRNTVIHYLTRKQFDFVNVGKGGLHVQADTCFYYFQPHQYENLEFKNGKVRLIKESDSYIVRFGSTQRPIPVHLSPTGEYWSISYLAQGCTSYIETTPIENSSIQLLKNIPESLVNSVIRPFPWDPGSKLKYLSTLEVWGIIILCLIAIKNRRKLSKSEKEVIFGLTIFALTLFLLIGWTTPVLGAISRYRFPAQLALIIIAFISIKPLNKISWKSIF